MAEETSAVEIRDIPAEAVEVLEERAADNEQSLSEYLRDLILDDVAMPPDLEDMLVSLFGKPEQTD